MNKYSRYWHWLLFGTTLFIVPPNSEAQIGGNSTYDFLNIPVSARVAALGGNVICVKDDDVNLSLQNPSLLNSSMNNQLAMNYVNYLAGTNFGNVIYCKDYDSIGTFSVGMQFFNYGKFIEADPNGNITGQFEAGEYSLNLGYSRQLDSNFSVGANLKTIYSSLANYTSFGSAIDLGATYNNVQKRYTIAAVIQNMGIEWKPYVKGDREPLPFEMQMGISKKLKHAPFRFSIIAQHLQKWDLTYADSVTTNPLTQDTVKKNKAQVFGDKLMRHVVIGTEFLITKNFNLRAGFDYERRAELEAAARPGMAGFSFGFGLRIFKFQLSYGRAVYNIAGGTNQFSISTNMSDFYSKN